MKCNVRICFVVGRTDAAGRVAHRSARVEALVSALSSAASVSSASSSRSAAGAFLAQLRDMVQQLPGDGATSVREKLERLQAMGADFLSFFLL